MPAKPETDTNYEVGLKGEFFDRRLKVDLAAYLTNYENKQVSAQICSDGSTPSATGCAIGLTDSTLLTNAASAKIQGVELEWQYVPFRGLSVYGNTSYTYGYYVSYPGAAPQIAYNGQTTIDAAGAELGSEPIWQGNVGVALRA